MAENDIGDALSARALDTIDTVVATVNDKAVRPAIVAARGIVFGVIIAVVGITVADHVLRRVHPPDHASPATASGARTSCSGLLFSAVGAYPLLAPRPPARGLTCHGSRAPQGRHHRQRARPA